MQPSPAKAGPVRVTAVTGNANSVTGSNDRVLDRIAALAVQVLRTPCATITLIEEGENRIVASAGSAAAESDSDTGFCASAALHVDGVPIGVLRVTDTAPRHLDDRDQELLACLAELASEALRARRTATLGALSSGFAELIEKSADLVYSQDLSGRITYIGGAIERLTGLKREQVLGTNFADLLVPDDRPKFEEAITHQLGGGNCPTLDVRLRTADGRSVAVELRTRIVFDRGRPSGVEGLGFDVSRLRQA